MSLPPPPGINPPTTPLAFGTGSVVVDLVINTKAANMSVNHIQGKMYKLDNAMSDTLNEIRYMWSYFNHLATLGLGIAKKRAKTEQQLAGIQQTGLTIQILQTGFAVTHMVQMGIKYAAEGRWALAAVMFTIAASMGASQVSMAALQVKAQRAQQTADLMVSQIEAYSQ